jgi:hypothetical protein
LIFAKPNRFTDVNDTKSTIMKTRNLLILLPVLALTLGSCAKIKEALVVKQDVSFTISLPVTVNEPLKSTAAVINESKVFDPMEDATVASLAQKIQRFDMNSLTISVTAISDAPVTLNNANLAITASVDGETLTVNIPMDGTYNSGDYKTIGEEDFDILVSMLSALVPITVTLTGNTDKSPVSFTLINLLIPR